MTKAAQGGSRACCSAEVREAARRIVERSTREQGLPFHVEDAAVLARTARVLRAARIEGTEGGGAGE
jgi:hypothetical protein